MFYLFFLIVIVLLILTPQYWAKHTLEKYAKPREDLPGTGGELVEHLREKYSMDYLKLEETDKGDHYDPNTRTVRLSKEYLNEKSLTAVAVAAHEFGHALQHHQRYQALLARTKLVVFAHLCERFSGVFIILLPLLAFAPGGARLAPLLIFAVIFSMAMSTIVHLITLPVEFNASFAQALPILKEGRYINDSDLRKTRKILLACAMTYLAGSLSGLLNFWRWIRLFTRRF